jgi:hypothetical protein
MKDYEVVITKPGCRQYERLVKMPFLSWYALLSEIYDIADINRLDLTIDCKEKMLPIGDIINNVEKGQFRSKFETWKKSAKRGETISVEFGSPKSDCRDSDVFNCKGSKKCSVYYTARPLLQVFRHCFLK